MPRPSDDIRLESAQAHHQRLRLAFLLGRIDRRRQIDNGLRTLITSVVLAGVACAGCVGFAFVMQALARSQ
jgi:alkylhydroperoxidase/carboxymuconolactone decarboxylase family protein YurZ